MIKNLKYILSDETKTIDTNKGELILHRLQAVKNFGDVHAGDLGGWIESEDNLSQDGKCWVYDEAMVYGSAYITDDAIVCDSAIVVDAHIYDCSYICERATVCGSSYIYDQAVIAGDAVVYSTEMRDETVICDNAHVKYSIMRDEAEVDEHARVGNSELAGSSYVSGEGKVTYSSRLVDSTVTDNALAETIDLYNGVILADNAVVSGNSSSHFYRIHGPAHIGAHALIRSEADFLIVGPFNSMNICIYNDIFDQVIVSYEGLCSDESIIEITCCYSDFLEAVGNESLYYLIESGVDLLLTAKRSSGK